MTPYGLGRNPNHVRENARESGIFGFPWFQPCLFSQERWGAETWPGNIELTVVIGESPKKFMKFWHRAAEIWDLEDGQNCDFPSLISQQPYVRTSWNFFWWLSYYNSQFDIPWPCLGTSPFLRKKTWLKPWKSKNATFSGLVLWHGWDFGHGPKEEFGNRARQFF